MPVTIRILQWNIQNYGPTKSGVFYNNYDVNRAIAKIVVDSHADIFVMLELNTTSVITATMVAQLMRTALQQYAHSKGRQEFGVCVLSPNTGREFYAFFIRDNAVTVPLPITGATGVGYVPPLLGGWEPAITSAYFDASTATGVIPQFFPLLTPDMSQRNLRSGSAAAWPGTRYPALGLFYLPGAAPVNRLLPIVVCHFAATLDITKQQFEALPYFRLLRGLSDIPVTPIALRVTPPGTHIRAPIPINHYVFLGDFNIDYKTSPDSYANLTGYYPNLGATAWIHDNTHLVTYRSFSPRDYKTTESLAISDYDNFFTRVNPGTTAAVTPGNPAWWNVPQMVRARQVRLSDSVQHYQELDKRGFSDAPYQWIVTDFASQLSGDWSNWITLPGALVGGRLISDHLPVQLDITL